MIPQLITSWEQLSELPPNKDWHIEVDFERGNGHIVRRKPTGDLWEDRHYLSTHTFYRSQAKHTTKRLQDCGFNVEIYDWDRQGVIPHGS